MNKRLKYVSPFDLGDLLCYNRHMDNLNLTVAKNLTELRKQNKLTQLEVAEKLNYSDKAVSKWEQGESLPGIEVLYRLSRLYGVSLDYLVGDEKAPKSQNVQPIVRSRRRIITLLSVLAVWLTSTILYISFDIALNTGIWMVFCWSVPASLIVAIVFDVIWHKSRFLFLLISALVWSVLLCFCLQFLKYNIWIILAAGIPLQAATLLWRRLVKY